MSTTTPPDEPKVQKNGKTSGAGRPPLNLDVEQIEDLARIQCTMDEIASVMRCSKSTLEKVEKYYAAIKRGRDGGKKSVKRALYENATEHNNVTAQIWFGKQFMGQSDKVDQKHEHTNEVTVDDLLGKRIVLERIIVDREDDG